MGKRFPASTWLSDAADRHIGEAYANLAKLLFGHRRGLLLGRDWEA